MSKISPLAYIHPEAIIGENCEIGPNAYVRENCIIGDEVKIGNFVEVKNTTIGSNTNACHLSYLGHHLLTPIQNILQIFLLLIDCVVQHLMVFQH